MKTAIEIIRETTGAVFTYQEIDAWEPMLTKAMKEFAKMHVKAALEDASKKATWDSNTRETFFGDKNRGDYDFYDADRDGDLYQVHNISVNKESILNAYPETNIK